eukprot:3415742-Alexandrium_andersonii.AAC.1
MLQPLSGRGVGPNAARPANALARRRPSTQRAASRAVSASRTSASLRVAPSAAGRRVGAARPGESPRRP